VSPLVLLAEAPALPLHKAGKFVAGAYIVFVAVILIYVTIMAVRLTRNQRELAELRRELLAREHAGEAAGDSETTAHV
jgi:HAMP domain-containing protein